MSAGRIGRYGPDGELLESRDIDDAGRIDPPLHFEPGDRVVFGHPMPPGAAPLGLGKAPGPTGPPSFTNNSNRDVTIKPVIVLRPGDSITGPARGTVLIPTTMMDLTWRPATEPPVPGEVVWAWGPELTSWGMPVEGPVLATHTHWPARPAVPNPSWLGGHFGPTSRERPARDDWNSATEWDQDGEPDELRDVTHWAPCEPPAPPA